MTDKTEALDVAGLYEEWAKTAPRWISNIPCNHIDAFEAFRAGRESQAREIAELKRANEQLFAHGESMYAKMTAAESALRAALADAERWRLIEYLLLGDTPADDAEDFATLITEIAYSHQIDIGIVSGKVPSTLDLIDQLVAGYRESLDADRQKGAT